MVENPWPDFDMGNRRTIRTILMELGSGIAEKTSDMIRFDVETNPYPNGDIKHRCRLHLVPIRYDYPLFSVTQHGISKFPVTIEAEALGGSVTSSSEPELKDTIKLIIASESTRNVVEQMLDAAS